MSAEVETMFSVREVPWHGLGTIVKEAPTSLDALHLAGLDWDVIQKPVQLVGGDVIPGVVANVRSTDKSVLGVVTPKYKIVQNKDAFDFTDNLLGSGVVYETAGALFSGRTIWLLAKMPRTTILGDDVDPYLCFTNSHDGKGSIHVCMTPIRVVCNNTLNIALSNAQKQWSTRHLGDVKSKMIEAERALGLAEKYMENLDATANIFVNKDISDSELDTIIYKLFPENPDMTQRSLVNLDNMRSQLKSALNAEDIKKFSGTQWGVIQGVSDFMTHYIPTRTTGTFNQNRFANIISSETVLDKTIKLLQVS